MQLLIVVINDPDRVDEVFSGFVELGVKGATILASEGMGHFLSHEVPIFAGLSTLLSGSRPQNRTILSVISDDLVDSVFELIQDVARLDEPGAGIAFTLPVSHVSGMARGLGEDRSI